MPRNWKSWQSVMGLIRRTVLDASFTNGRTVILVNQNADARVVVLGARGQVGSALLRQCEQRGRPALGLTREDLDFSVPDQLVERLKILFTQELLAKKPIAVIINAMAYTQVDRAEVEYDLAMRVNAESPGILAQWCVDHDIPLIHYSTDYVFDGSGQIPWREADQTRPLNSYGKSKCEGEVRIRAAGGQFLILRTSWVYDAMGKNFLKTMLKLGTEKEVLKVVADQVGAPTYADDLAAATLQILQKIEERSVSPAFSSGVYHCRNEGETNWCEFARTIFEEVRRHKILLRMPLKVQCVEAINTAEYPTPARRPLNSRLDGTQLKQTFGITLPNWREGLEACLEQMKNLDQMTKGVSK
jgi:dTDP-4-dehydrorhamnose reductase